MKAIKVEYTVREDFVKTNKENISAVMNELKGLNAGVKYFVSIKEDGKSFVHIAISRDEQSRNVIPNLESFKKFQEQLKTGLESPPKSENLETVNSSFDIF
jgi:putative heme iron utilization protein